MNRKTSKTSILLAAICAATFSAIPAARTPLILPASAQETISADPMETTLDNPSAQTRADASVVNQLKGEFVKVTQKIGGFWSDTLQVQFKMTNPTDQPLYNVRVKLNSVNGKIDSTSIYPYAESSFTDFDKDTFTTSINETSDSGCSSYLSEFVIPKLEAGNQYVRFTFEYQPDTKNVFEGAAIGVSVNEAYLDANCTLKAAPNLNWYYQYNLKTPQSSLIDVKDDYTFHHGNQTISLMDYFTNPETKDTPLTLQPSDQIVQILTLTNTSSETLRNIQVLGAADPTPAGNALFTYRFEGEGGTLQLPEVGGFFATNAGLRVFAFEEIKPGETITVKIIYTPSECINDFARTTFSQGTSFSYESSNGDYHFCASSLYLDPLTGAPLPSWKFTLGDQYLKKPVIFESSDSKNILYYASDLEGQTRSAKDLFAWHWSETVTNLDTGTSTLTLNREPVRLSKGYPDGSRKNILYKNYTEDGWYLSEELSAVMDSVEANKPFTPSMIPAQAGYTRVRSLIGYGFDRYPVYGSPLSDFNGPVNLSDASNAYNLHVVYSFYRPGSETDKPSNDSSTQKPVQKPEQGEETPSQEGLIEIDGIKYIYSEGTPVHNAWVEINGKWYHSDEQGAVLTSRWFTDTDTFPGTYYLNEQGEMHTGWLEKDGKTYFMDNAGRRKSNWLKSNDDWHFFDQDGIMQVNGWTTDSTGSYKLSNGKLLTSQWISENGKWRYVDNSGKRKENSWLFIDGFWYHMDADGYAQTGWIELDGKSYYLYPAKTGSNPEGSMAADTTIDGYYVDQDGVRM